MVDITYEGPRRPDIESAGVQPGFDAHGMVSGLVAYADLDRLDDLEGVVRVTVQPEVYPTLDGTVREIKVPWQNPSGGGFLGRGGGVIVAVIDAGIDIFHESFIKADGVTSRILELWDMTRTGLTQGSDPPATFAFGRVYDNEDITNALAAGSFESKDTSGHGTHVAGTAAGNGRQDDRCSFPGHYVGVAPEADLVVVKAIGVRGNIREALNWCAQAGSRHGGKAVVINCSFGHDTGPHDGTDDLDKYFNDLLRPPPPASPAPPEGLAIVCAAGNCANDDIHEAGTVQPGQTSTIPFYIPGKSLEFDLLDIWYDGASELSLEIIAPENPNVTGGRTTGVLAPPFDDTLTIGKMDLDVVSSDPLPDHNGRRQIRVSFEIAPETPGQPPPRLPIRPGLWELKLGHLSGPPAAWEAWFDTQGEDGYPTWRLPTDSSDPVPRRLENTINSPGTSPHVITVAAYSDGSGKLAGFSSHGRANQAGLPVGELKPTIAAPGVEVAASHSRDMQDDKGNEISNSSCCDQKVYDMDGTSMASPHVAGVVALMLEKNHHLTCEQARAHLQKSAHTDGIPAAEVPPEVDPVNHIRANALWGSGKVDALITLNDVPPASALGGGGGGGGGGGPHAPMLFTDLGYTPHTWPSRMADWTRRYEEHPGVRLLSALVSEHVDEVLWLVNNDRRVLVTWRRNGGHLLVRRLLYGPPPSDVLIPAQVDGYDVGSLLERITAALDRAGGSRLRRDLTRFGGFARMWPGATLAELDEAALGTGAAP